VTHLNVHKIDVVVRFILTRYAILHRLIYSYYV